MKKKLFLYPYTKSMDSLLKLKEELEEYVIETVGCFKEDQTYLMERYPELKIVCSYEEGLKDADSLLLNEELEEQMEEAAQKCKEYAIAQKKEILQEKETFEAIEDLRGYKLKAMEVPVLAILGSGEQCSKFESTSILAGRIREHGYHVLAISGNPYAKANKMEKIPDYFFRNTVDLETKIMNFNRYVAELCEKQNPDIIVVEIPGGILPIAKMEYFHFGEFALVVTEALEIDAAVYNVYENVATLDEKELESYLKTLAEHCLYKYRIPISFFAVSSQHLKPNKEEKKVEFLYLSPQFMQEREERQSNEKLVFLNNTKMMRDKVDEILKELTENAEVI